MVRQCSRISPGHDHHKIPPVLRETQLFEHIVGICLGEEGRGLAVRRFFGGFGGGAGRVLGERGWFVAEEDEDV